MRSLFRSFERHDLEYLLISGQASVLYGAATFSEDIDLWIRPTPRNTRRLLESLAACRARIHKLTPPIEQRFLAAGHGFHFVVPARPLPVYLDVLGRPPRVKSFPEAKARCLVMRTMWGTLPVVAIADLILLKRTRRLSDYEVISNLVRIEVERQCTLSPRVLRWAAKNTFRAEDRAHFLGLLGESVALQDCRSEILHEISRHQTRDARYWSRRIEQLKRLRRSNRLLPEGTPVEDLL
ncbi:MAG: hypothetical protein AB1486_00740 [Planctomycetota bacterium]